MTSGGHEVFTQEVLAGRLRLLSAGWWLVCGRVARRRVAGGDVDRGHRRRALLGVRLAGGVGLLCGRDERLEGCHLLSHSTLARGDRGLPVRRLALPPLCVALARECAAQFAWRRAGH